MRTWEIGGRRVRIYKYIYIFCESDFTVVDQRYCSLEGFGLFLSQSAVFKRSPVFHVSTLTAWGRCYYLLPYKWSQSLRWVREVFSLHANARALRSHAPVLLSCCQGLPSMLVLALRAKIIMAQWLPALLRLSSLINTAATVLSGWLVSKLRLEEQ